MLVLYSATTNLYTAAQSAQNEFSKLPSCELIQGSSSCSCTNLLYGSGKVGKEPLWAEYQKFIIHACCMFGYFSVKFVPFLY